LQWQVDAIEYNYDLAISGDNPADRFAYVAASLRKLKSELSPEQAGWLAESEMRLAKLQASRNLAFIATLMESGVEFVAADMPFANKLHILAAVAEHEREAISERTKAALAAAKARGTVSATRTPPTL
jgi:DNA invertase Pin-like site-specific DNA recombinase